MVIAALVERRGIGARAEQADALSMARLFSLDTDGVALICLCYIEGASNSQIHYAVRRVRRLAPDAIVLVALLRNGDENKEVPKNIDVVHGSLRATVDRVFAIASGHTLLERATTTS